MSAYLTERNEVAKYYANKRVLVTGGTGSFGHQIVKMLLDLDVQRIVILSRDEKKQYDMRDEYVGDPRLDFVIGDVRDYDTLVQAFRGVDVVYHAAALKQIPICENHPVEAVRTNILGAENVRRAALSNHVETVVSLSTDKAVKPVNAMGMTKALGEKIMLNQANAGNGTRFMCVRYGNVLGSRGSVVPLFRNRIDHKRPVPVTNPEMTRFLLTLSEAIDLVFHATLRGSSGHLYVRKMPACTVMLLAEVMTRAITGRADYPIECVGVRPGEKIHEVLVSEEEMGRAVESETFYDVMPMTTARVHEPPRLFEYRSDNTELLDADQLLQLLRTEHWV